MHFHLTDSETPPFSPFELFNRGFFEFFPDIFSSETSPDEIAALPNSLANDSLQWTT
jgi:hypothetical protein